MRDELPPRRLPPPREAPVVPPVPRRRRAGRPRSRLLIALLLLAMIGSAATGAYLRRVLANFGGESPIETLTETPFDGKRKVFVLIVGVDQKNRLLKSDERRSDTMILACFDLEQKRVAALSLPRDTRVRLPGHDGHDKLNAAHAYGGIPLVRQTVTELTSIPIDRYVKTDVNGFRAIVDLIGPIEVNVEKRMDYDDNWGNLHIHLKPGLQQLNGEQAMGYVRFRSDASGDLGRMQRQQQFLRAVARKLLTPTGLARLPQVIDRAMQYIETDLTAREVITLGKEFRDISMSQITTATLPGTARYIGRVSFFVAESERLPDVLQKLFFSTAPVARTSVEVLNGNGLPGIASEAARTLKANGFHVSRTGNAANYEFKVSEFRVTEGHEPDARRAASLLGVESAAIVTVAAGRGASGGDAGEARVTVVLGKDYRP